MSSTQKKHSEKALKVIEVYGDGLKFAETFNPSLQTVCATNELRSFMGLAPTIGIVCQTYEPMQVNTWIMAQLLDLYKFAGVANKMDIEQMKSVAEIIKVEYYYLKASELLLFFHKLKAGHYGSFYGSVDPMVITSALREFCAYRRQQIEIYERERKKKEFNKQLEEWKEKAVPCPDGLLVAKEYCESIKDNPNL